MTDIPDRRLNDGPVKLLAEGVLHLGDKVDQVSRALDDERHWRRRAMVALIFALAVLLAASIIGIVLLGRAATTADDARRTAELIEDCVTPDGECAKRQTGRGAAILEAFKEEIQENRRLILEAIDEAHP